MNDKIINPESGRPVKILGKSEVKEYLVTAARQTGGKSPLLKRKINHDQKNTNKKSKSISKKFIDKHIQQLFQ